MRITTLFLLAVGLAMDAFAVSICKGLATQKLSARGYLTVGLWFGSFQALMPMIGYLLSVQFKTYIDAVSSWVAFFLLLAIGGNMIREALSKEEEDCNCGSLAAKEMFLLAIATSIDAMAVGITFSCVPVQVFSAVGPLGNTLFGAGLIGVCTCIISMAGVKIGNLFGTKYRDKAEFFGGVILVLIGTKILLEHFGIL